MKKSSYDFILAIVLALVLPMLLFSLVSSILYRRQADPNLEGSTQTTDASDGVYSTVLVEMRDGSVKKLPLESYILSVVLREMPATFHSEALKAQAVVARTYTVRLMEKGKKHPGAHVCTDSACCQGYWDPEEYLSSGGTTKNLATITAAVNATTSQILVYEDKPIEATYFSCSGGTTEDAVAVWGTDVPYLKATSSPGEEAASHYMDTVRYSVTELAKKLDVKLEKGSVFRIGKITYTSGGGVDTIEICGKRFKGTDVRKALGLKSTAFVISVAGSNATITTKGYGHRVGMSQYGADAMAVAGSDYLKILLHYYRGVELLSLDALC